MRFHQAFQKKTSYSFRSLTKQSLRQFHAARWRNTLRQELKKLWIWLTLNSERLKGVAVFPREWFLWAEAQTFQGLLMLRKRAFGFRQVWGILKRWCLLETRLITFRLQPRWGLSTG